MGDAVAGEEAAAEAPAPGGEEVDVSVEAPAETPPA